MTDNITRAEGRADPTSTVVAVYRCLTPSKPTFSIRAEDGPDKGKVIGWADELTLTGCEFIVKRTTHRKILSGESKRGRKRNVVAWVTGKIADAEIIGTDSRVDFTFYPEDSRPGMPVGEFHDTTTGVVVTTANAVRFTTVTTADGKRHGRAMADL